MKVFLRLLLLILLFISYQTAEACTTFCIQKDGRKVFGKNYDWVTGTGVIHTNVRGLEKISLTIEEGNSLSWLARYGSITFNQFGKEFPNGGMNEKGLVVELMWLNESKYPQKDQRPSLSVLQWIQYQLDNAATVEEVIASDKKIRVFSTGTPQHYLVADKKGAVATIEFINGKMEVHKESDLPYPVLANSTYAASIAALKDSNSRGNNSLQRFSTACEMIKNLQVQQVNTPLVDYAFQVLGKVAQGSFTKWSIVYDIDNMIIHFKAGGQENRSLDFKRFDFACNKLPRSYDLHNKQTGDVTTAFVNYSAAQNEIMLKRAFEESRSQFRIPMPLQERMAKMAGVVSCAE
jgi:predicted choloylglycine hydrolase